LLTQKVKRIYQKTVVSRLDLNFLLNLDSRFHLPVQAPVCVAAATEAGGRQANAASRGDINLAICTKNNT